MVPFELGFFPPSLHFVIFIIPREGDGDLSTCSTGVFPAGDVYGCAVLLLLLGTKSLRATCLI